MKWKRLGLILLRFTILFAVSATLVGGFWFHAELYKLGLPAIMVAGPIIVILMILAFRFAVSGEFRLVMKPKMSLEFEFDDIEKVRHGVKTSMLRKPQGSRDIKPGSVVTAKIKGRDVGICSVRIIGIDRKYLADFEQNDLISLGIVSEAELSDLWTGLGGQMDEGEYSELVFFEPLGKGKRT